MSHELLPSNLESKLSRRETLMKNLIVLEQRQSCKLMAKRIYNQMNQKLEIAGRSSLK